MTLEEMIDLVAEHIPMRGNGQDLAAPIIAALRDAADTQLRVKNQEETIRMLKAEWLSLADWNKELLRAGQAMRDGIEVYDGPRSEYAKVIHKASVAEACNAWDAVVGEKE